MNNTLLINEALLKSRTTVNENINSEMIVPSIVIAQECGLRQVLGPTLYNKVILEANSENIKPSYKILIEDYIQPYLIEKTLSDLVYSLTFKLRQMGVVALQDEKCTTASQLLELKLQYDNQAGYYSVLLVNYLKQHSSEFPEFKCNGGIDFDNVPINLA